MEERKQLIPILIKARSMGKMAYLRQNFIFIENKKHSLQDIKQSQQYHELTTEENTAANEVPAALQLTHPRQAVSSGSRTYSLRNTKKS
ncbi:hypothetical protein JTB14_030090 [Gonioctena quinquepunctata]|nr:hypothetical protein JTB14_030090 [Gonioctena quinquepunctata]